MSLLFSTQVKAFLGYFEYPLLLLDCEGFNHACEDGVCGDAIVPDLLDKEAVALFKLGDSAFVHY